MDKATKVIKRSGAKLKGLSGRHGNLHVLISQLGDTRSAFKGFIATQQTAMDDLIRWTSDCDNRAVQDVCSFLAELSFLWTEVQREFAERLREFRTQFELILEGERHVDQSRELYCAREQREIKCRKELTKNETKSGTEEIKVLEERVVQAVRSKDLAYLEVVDRIKENEAVKLIRMREGLRKLSSGYVTLGEKCQAIFNAYFAVSSTLPVVMDKDVTQLRYTGGREAAQHVKRAKEQVLSHKGGLLPDTTNSESDMTQPQYIRIPDEKPCMPSKQKETEKAEVAAATSNNSDCSGPRTGYDPPPSYTSVVQADACCRNGASGFTPAPSNQVNRSPYDDSSCADLPIQVSYPSYLFPGRRESRPRDIPSAPSGLEQCSLDFASSRNSAILQRNSSRGLSRTVSERTFSRDYRVSVHPVLRQQEQRTERCNDEYADVVTRNELQMSSLRAHKTQRRLGLKSLSFASNAISGLLGLNGSSRPEPGRPIQFDDYEPLEFNRMEVSEENRIREDLSGVHGILPDCLEPHNQLNRAVKDKSDQDKSSRSQANEKQKALSAKFQGDLHTNSFREHLSTDAELATKYPSLEMLDAACRRTKNSEDKIRKKSRSRVRQSTSSIPDVITLSGTVRANSHDRSSIGNKKEDTENKAICNDLICLEGSNNCCNSKPEGLKPDTNVIVDDMVDNELKSGNKEEYVASVLQNARQDSKDSTQSEDLDSGIQLSSSSNYSDKLDGYLNKLVRPRQSIVAGKVKNTNPFLEDEDETVCESDQKNCTNFQR